MFGVAPATDEVTHLHVPFSVFADNYNTSGTPAPYFSEIFRQAVPAEHKPVLPVKNNR